MRTLIACGVVGLALGLAAHWLPRAPAGDSSAELVGGVPMAPKFSKAQIPVARDVPLAGDEGTVAEFGADAPGMRDSDKLAVSVAPSSVALSAETERDRTARLIAAGFTRDRALELVQRESQLRRAAIDREYATTGTIRPLNASSPSAVEQQLRREMGDAEYEKYLAAGGQTTRVRVGEVESDSAAANAGILSGDEILEYAGRRVFNLRELHALMLQTPEGKTVATTVVRDGQTMQLYVTGGALGIASSGTH